MTEPHIQLLDDLEREVVQAAEYLRRREPERRPRLARFGWRTPAVAVGLVAVLAGGAAAAGVLPTVQSEPSPPPEGITAEPSRMFIEGATERAHAWRLASSDDGARFCLMLLVESQAPNVSGAPTLKAWAPSGSSCDLRPNTASVAVGDSTGDGVGWLYGTAPEVAVEVEVRSAAGEVYRVDTVEDPQGARSGRFFVLELPAAALGDSTVTFRDETGEPVGDSTPTRELADHKTP